MIICSVNYHSIIMVAHFLALYGGAHWFRPLKIERAASITVEGRASLFIPPRSTKVNKTAEKQNQLTTNMTRSHESCQVSKNFTKVSQKGWFHW